MERWHRPGRQTASRDTELLELGAKLGYLEFLAKRPRLDTVCGAVDNDDEKGSQVLLKYDKCAN